MSDVAASPVYAAYSQMPPQTGVLWSSEPSEFSPGAEWANLPGAVIPFLVGQGCTVLGGVFVATFSAEAAVRGEGGVGMVDITFGGEPASPRGENHPFVSAGASGLALSSRTAGQRTDQVCISERVTESWSSHTITRARQYSYDAVNRRNAEVKVRVRLEGGEKLTLKNWLVQVVAYPWKDARTT
ncbi:hypothetical protein [Streptomyces sp. ADI96-02]|uniref:hypothetical protein n=1 Tax=Streptomyces sp. ADI96-02 TaxID=1522760 RepID=UPI000F55754F|nr:hypothetical protein [Streptomyces sp. ADI96-02]